MNRLWWVIDGVRPGRSRDVLILLKVPGEAKCHFVQYFVKNLSARKVLDKAFVHNVIFSNLVCTSNTFLFTFHDIQIVKEVKCNHFSSLD